MINEQRDLAERVTQLEARTARRERVCLVLLGVLISGCLSLLSSPSVLEVRGLIVRGEGGREVASLRVYTGESGGETVRLQVGAREEGSAVIWLSGGADGGLTVRSASGDAGCSMSTSDGQACLLLQGGGQLSLASSHSAGGPVVMLTGDGGRVRLGSGPTALSENGGERYGLFLEDKSFALGCELSAPAETGVPRLRIFDGDALETELP